MAYRVKKFRGYRRMLRKLIRVVEDYQPDWRPDEADGREECKIFLFMPGGDLGQAEIVLIYDRERFETFWLRTDPADGLWTLQKDRSLLTELGLSSTLPERCVLEEFHWAGYVERTLIWGYGDLP